MGAASPVGRLVGASLQPPELEAAYRVRFLRPDARVAAGVLALLSLLGVGFAASDATFVSDPAIRARLVALRIAYVAACAIIGILIVRTRRPGVVDGAYLAWTMLGAGLVVAIQSTRPPNYYLPIVEAVFYVFTLWTMTTGRFVIQALSAGIVTAATLTWIVAFRDAPPRPVAMLLGSSLLLPNVVGAVVAWRTARIRRSQFLALREAEEASAAVRQREERLLGMLSALPVPILYGDGSQRILFVNDEFERVFGYGLADLPDAGRWFELAYPDPGYRRQVAESWAARVERARAGDGSMEPAELRIRCKGGEDRIVQARGAYLFDSLIAAFHDLTDQKR